MIELPDHPRPRASIIIVVSSAKTPLRCCLERLVEAAPAVPFETIIVLNGLTLEEESGLRADVEGACFADSELHLGLAGALNLGRTKARGEFIVSLHDDAEVKVDWLDALVETAESDRRVGAVGSLVLGGDGKVQAAGMRLLRDGSTCYPWDGEPPSADEFVDAHAVDYSGSCSLLVRASTWDRIGGADERLFPVYYVDVDLCLAIRARGEQVLLQPRSVVTHPGGASTDRDFAQFVYGRNRELMLEKWGELISSHTPGSGTTYSPSDDAPPRQFADPDRRSRLMRQAALTRAYEDDLRSRLASTGGELAELRERLEETREGWAELEREYRRTLSALQAERSHRESVVAEITLLRKQSALLGLIEQSRWWRLLAGMRLRLRRAARQNR